MSAGAKPPGYRLRKLRVRFVTIDLWVVGVRRPSLHRGARSAMTVRVSSDTTALSSGMASKSSEGKIPSATKSITASEWLMMCCASAGLKSLSTGTIMAP